MPGSSARFPFLHGWHARVLTLLLLAQFGAMVGLSRKEYIPQIQPLQQFPQRLGGWSMYQEGSVEKEVMDVLRADDVLTRTYIDPTSSRAANLFIAFFKSQRTGQTPHSPKNCLPGSGWVPSQSDTVTIPVSGRNEPITVNRYVVSKGEDRSLVLYWYQSRDRIIASEYSAKFYLVADSIRLNRSDTSLVRIVVPVVGNDVAAANQTAVDFVQAIFGALKQYLPS